MPPLPITPTVPMQVDEGLMRGVGCFLILCAFLVWFVGSRAIMAQRRRRLGEARKSPFQLLRRPPRLSVSTFNWAEKLCLLVVFLLTLGLIYAGYYVAVP